VIEIGGRLEFVLIVLIITAGIVLYHRPRR
jgi:hypothetical protein